MLRSLRIKNFVIIEDELMEFDSGLNVLSGESGAGKSIVLDALELLLGARAKGDYFRAETDGWDLDALFEVGELSPELLALLPDVVRSVLENSDELVISRSMTRSGKGRCFVGGKLVSVGTLAEVGACLMSICTQRESLVLFNASKQLSLIDEFGRLGDALERYRQLYHAWRLRERALESFLEQCAEQQRRAAEAQGIIDELAPIKHLFGRRSEIEHILASVRDTTKNSEVLESLVNSCLAEGGLLAVISNMRRGLRELKSQDKLREEIEEALTICYENASRIEELAQRAQGQSEYSDAELESFRRELSELARLERKYRLDGEALTELFASQEELLSQFENSSLEEKTLRQALSDSHALLIECANSLRAARNRVARTLSKQAARELGELGLQGARLNIEFQSTDPGPDGSERVRMLFQANPGEEPKLLQDIASGGEVSRLMLVLRALIDKQTGVQVLVFDEVDTGVSGQVARAMGLKLRELGQSAQVLCISHLPQVASLADRHFVIEKRVGKRTHTKVRLLATEDDRIEEIARMLSGYAVTAASRESARELISSKDQAVSGI